VLEIAGYIADGNTIQASCAAAGIHRTTYYDWLDRGRDGDESNGGLYVMFAEMIEKAESAAEMDHVSNIKSAGRVTWQASAWWLERRNPKDWGKRPPPPEETPDDDLVVIG